VKKALYPDVQAVLDDSELWSALREAGMISTQEMPSKNRIS